ncbi:MAG: diguanylate cyclase [Acidobacteriota bacterium]|nr:diguanylate cyclase [Acidobacteriota bacterium]
MDSTDFSPIAVTFQCGGTLLLALMMAQLGRIFAWRYARRWALAWTAMFLGLVSVRIYISTHDRGWWAVYLVAQWCFLILLYGGCRDLTDRHVDLRRLIWGVPIAIAGAIVLSRAMPNFNALFVFEAAVVATGSLLSFIALGRRTHRTAGWQMMRVAIALIAILFYAYVPLYGALLFGWELSFLTYSSLADLLASVLLGFGMVLVTSEEAHRELHDAVTALSIARDQLERKLRIDPLTDALSRHAFNTMPSGLSGVVIMIDLDHLKQINDESGHAAGDSAIRAAANALRTRIRADDLLFRWGGDEFLAVMPAATIEQVQERLAPLADGVVCDEPPITLFLSWGAAEFGDARSLDEAIRVADAEMYERREVTRSA